MRLLHFSAEDGRHEAVWFTDEDDSPDDLAKEIGGHKTGLDWRFDWEVDVSGTCLPATETPYFKDR